LGNYFLSCLPVCCFFFVNACRSNYTRASVSSSSKRWCNNDMGQLFFCMFSQKHGPQMDQKQTRVLTIGFFEHTALCKFENRLSRTFAFYLCKSRLPRNVFHIIIVETIHFCTVLVLVLYRTYQDAFKARKTTQFSPFS